MVCAASASPLIWLLYPIAGIGEKQRKIRKHDKFDFRLNIDIACTGVTILSGSSHEEQYRLRLDEATGYNEIWQLVKDSAKTAIGKQRVGMMLFLDDLPIQLGAYHPVGTNNIILNRALVEVVEAATKSQRLLNAFVYILLLHEYLHALGYLRESEARQLVYTVSQRSFGEDHITSRLARTNPWVLLKNVPLGRIEAPKRAMEIVKDFEQSNQQYIV